MVPSSAHRSPPATQLFAKKVVQIREGILKM